MQDHTCIEAVGLVCLTLIALGGLIIDGDVGNTVATAAAGAVGVAVGYVYKAYNTKPV